MTVKIILISNPNNPLGVIYSPNAVRNIVEWARARKMHTIVDEIYALSVFDDDSFRSVAQILDNDLGNDVHFLWALSKDFASSGFRVGVLYSQNAQLMDALGNLNVFSGVSHPMQLTTARMLSDDEFVDSFLDQSRAKLRTSYELCTSKLTEMGVPYTPARAGMFVYCDFSSLLPLTTTTDKRLSSFEGERRFAALVQDRARVVMTPGESQRDPTPGMFRICYAWVSIEVLEIGMNRIQRVVNLVQEYGWEEMEKNPSLLDDVIAS